ncbi:MULTISPECIES: hypothetical protein [Cohnella]|uniref:hypothetical protein n=1 Tax=Cohnella TaxID=329857 RepID=UPI0009B98294|nr:MULTISPECIES: hypothetical protein [Cohnella]MBN2981036.1 hypothetical protein [Cohnella algarum]
MKPRIIWASLIALTIVTAVISIYLISSNNTIQSAPNEDYATIVQKEVQTQTEIDELISSMDDNLTVLVGDGTDFFTTEILADTYWQEFIENASFDEEDLENAISINQMKIINDDLQNIKKLIHIAKAKRDVQSIVYAYYILNDLNHWVFNPELETDKYFAATETLQLYDDKSMVNKIKTYIGKNN